ncbi:MAG: beta-galactosidase [bacterium]
MKRPIAFLVIALAAAHASAAWEAGTRFRVEQVNGKPCLVAPDGTPFKSVGMVWAYGPERGPLANRVDKEKLIRHLALIKSLGFNTLNLYGDQMISGMLAWCDENELAVYFRTAFNDIQGLSPDQREFPDLMDPTFREKAKKRYAGLLAQVRRHPSVLAIDTDNRWLFPVEWSGTMRIDQPKLGPHGLDRFPEWLKHRYGSVEAMNAAWDTSFAGFDGILHDRRAARDGMFHPLGNNPWRVDVYQYVLWTQADFLGDLAAYLKAESDGVLVTATTEHPECVPDTNPSPDAGIDFMSPVHYNTVDDYQRDLPALCKLIYETRWHYDMQGGPTYISESGWRTSPLEQNPPNLGYAMMEPRDEDVAAKCYAMQFSLLNVLPWVSGYGYFKLYDKVPEGDFGYLRDDGTRKPQAFVGDAINRAFAAADMPDPEPQAWIYYPDYAIATHRPGFKQIKSFVFLWEKAFLDALRGRVDQYWIGLRGGDRDAGAAFAQEVTADFKKLWRGFAFARTLPRDDKPIVLLSTVSEILSYRDRAALMDRKTLSFGDAGLLDDAMRPTPSWLRESLRLDQDAVMETRTAFDPATGKDLPEKKPWWSWIPWYEEKAWTWRNHLAGPVTCTGQTLKLSKGYCKQVELLAGSTDGDAAASCELVYADDGSTVAILGPTVSDTRFKPVMTEGVKIAGEYWSAIALPVDPHRKLVALRLPDARWIRIRGAVKVSGGATTNTTVVLRDGKETISGDSKWVLGLGEGARSKLKVLKSFANGSPAVAASGSHVAFLYDALDWGAGTNEISRFVDLHHAWVDQAMKYLEER